MRAGSTPCARVDAARAMKWLIAITRSPRAITRVVGALARHALVVGRVVGGHELRPGPPRRQPGRPGRRARAGMHDADLLVADQTREQRRVAPDPHRVLGGQRQRDVPPAGRARPPAPAARRRWPPARAPPARAIACTISTVPRSTPPLSSAGSTCSTRRRRGAAWPRISRIAPRQLAPESTLASVLPGRAECRP